MTPPKDQARNRRRQFAPKGKDKDVSVASKEVTSVLFAAAALTYMSQNPQLFSEKWTTGAKKNEIYPSRSCLFETLPQRELSNGYCFTGVVCLSY